MEDLQVHVAMNSRYRVFDRSGKLPFTIIFGLSRRSSEDTDPLPLLINTKNTILDIPYALSNNVLSLRIQQPDSKLEVEVEVDQSSPVSNERKSSVTLPSPVGHVFARRTPLVIYEYYLDPKSELSSFLELGKKYRIRINHRGVFGGEGHKFVDEATREDEQNFESSKKHPKLVLGRTEGTAIFTILPSLSWPPEIQTTMRQLPGDESAGITKLEITSLNTGTGPITVQTRGRQNFLLPGGPVYEEDEWSTCPRIVDGQQPSAHRNIQVINLNDNSTVRKPNPPGGFQQGPIGDRRPKLNTLVTLKPGEPLVRHVDVSELLSDLADGIYGLRMERRGMWWCEGDPRDFVDDGDERVPHDMFRTMLPPLILECKNTVDVHIKNDNPN